MSERKFPVRTLLFVSLAINLLAAGAVAGAWFAGVRVARDAPPEATFARMPGARAFVRAMPDEVRPRMREEMAASVEESRSMREAARAARLEAFAAASAEPYDAGRVRSAFAKLREADQAAIAVFHENVVAAFADMTPQQRRAALAALAQAAPASRVQPAPEAAQERLTPEERQDLRQRLRERRRERRERMRERMESAGGP
jgi:uncharacterized membrane protein